MVKSVVEVEIDVPQATAAALFVGPGNMTAWMDDLDRVEAIDFRRDGPRQEPAR